jgi:hypothetical protein
MIPAVQSRVELSSDKEHRIAILTGAAQYVIKGYSIKIKNN